MQTQIKLKDLPCSPVKSFQCQLMRHTKSTFESRNLTKMDNPFNSVQTKARDESISSLRSSHVDADINYAGYPNKTPTPRREQSRNNSSTLTSAVVSESR